MLRQMYSSATIAIELKNITSTIIINIANGDTVANATFQNPIKHKPNQRLPLEAFYSWVDQQPTKTYMTQPMGMGEIRTYSWQQTMDESLRMAAYLKSFGWPAGTKIAIMSKNCAWWIMSDLAIWMAGYVSVPLYPTLAAETVGQIIAHSESKAIFIGKLDDWELMSPGVPEGIERISYPLSPPNNYPTWEDIIAKTKALEGRPTRAADDLSTLIYTSGTTGMPKGVMHSFANFAAAIESGAARVGLNGSDRMLSYLPLAHVAERILVEQGSFITGMSLYFAESLDTFAADLQRATPTIFFSVPRLWVKFQQAVEAKMPAEKLTRLLKIPIIRGIVKKKILTTLGLNHCRVAVGGAAPMPPELLRWYDRLGLNILEAYGMTENGAVSHATLSGKPSPGTVGQQYEGVETRLDPDTSEIQIRCSWLMQGYYKEPEQTQQAFTPDGWLKTGDKGAFDSDNNLKITGRVKDLFKTSKGKYIAPAKIEDRLVMNNFVEACAVVGANLGQPLGLLMLSPLGLKTAQEGKKAEIDANFSAFLKSVNAGLDPHEQMSSFIIVKDAWTVDSGFITPTFKIKRNKIEEAYGSNFEKWSRSRAPVVWEGA
jgi:long-chain acyl-CoA synthetase